MKNKATAAELGMVLVTVIWGYGFIATKIAIEHFSSYQIIFYRFAISTVITGAIYFKDIKNANKQDVKRSFILGLFLCGGFLTQTMAINYTTVAKNAFLTTLNVIFVPIITAMFYRKKVDFYSIISCLLAITGTGILSLNADLSINKGDVLSIICAVFFSFHIFYLGEYANHSKLSVLVTGQIAASTVCAFIASLLAGNLLVAQINTKAALGVLYLAVFSTCAAFAMQTYCQKYTSAVKAVVIFSLEAVFASIFAFIIFHEPITPRFLVGSSVIFTAVIISSTKAGSIQSSAG